MIFRVWARLARRGRVLLMVACLALPWVVPRGTPAEMFRPLDVGESLQGMSLNDTEGVRHTLTPTNSDRPVLLFFWSVYCPNCKEAMPGLVELAEDTSGPPVEVWGINVDGERFSNSVKVYLREMELPFTTLYDRLEGEYLVAADPLGVSKTPTLYLAGRDGRVLLRQVVHIDMAAVRAALRSSVSP